MNNTRLIVGLGNPGSKYVHTRHNIGFLVINKLAQSLKIKSSETEDDYEFAVKDYKDTTIVLMKPLTFMNRSGFAVREFFENYEVSAENVLVIHDDVNLDFGTLRLRPSGSDGGHKGIQSIIYEMHTEDIPRLRIGVKNVVELEKYYYEVTPEENADNVEKKNNNVVNDEFEEEEDDYSDIKDFGDEEPAEIRPVENKSNGKIGKYDLAEYVLSNFTQEETEKMDIILSSAKDAVLSFIESGIKETMNRFNKNVLE